MKVLASVFCVLVLVGVLLAEGGDPWGVAVRHGGGGSLDQHWGPDAFGYYARNQQESGGPTPLWTDISAYGTRVTGTGDDNAIGPFPIGFTFRYYWYDVNQFWVGSNGYIKFSSRGQLGTPFVQYPNTGPPNDVVGVYTADWVLSGTNPTDSSCYYWSNFTDTLIVMWKNVAAYLNDGSHNFELILSGVDSSITFQYGTQTGTVTADAIGIENLTGSVGLNTLFGTYPTANTAIRFDYPDSITYSSPIVDVVAIQNPLNNGFFMRPGDTLRPWIQIANLGNQTAAQCSVSFNIHHPGGPFLTSFDTALTTIGPLDTVTLRPALNWLAVDTGTYLAQAVTGNWGGSHGLLNELHVVNLPGELHYDDGVSDRQSGWNTAGRAVAMEFVPPAYPTAVTQTRVYFGLASAAYDVSILLNDGPDGTPGTEIWRHHFATSATGWNTVTVPSDSATIQNGSFFVAYWTPSGVQLGFDTTYAQGISHRAWEYINGWGQNKWWNIADPLIRCSLMPIFPPPGPFVRQLPVDGSTIPWMQGLIQFRWTTSHDSGTTVTYRLTVNSGDYHRTFATTDTTYADSLAWFYGGLPHADVTWSVWATNGQDSVQATNGQGFFHLNANHAPGAFLRVAPPDTFLGTSPIITCRWTRSHDVDGDPVGYVFHCEHRPGYWPVHPADTLIGDTSLVLRIDLPIFATMQHFYWTVFATDGMDTTMASNGEGHFWIDVLAAPGHNGELPRELAVRSYPNPFNSVATLTYDIPAASDMELKIFNLAGEEVALLHQGYITPGRYRVEWNASAQASGTYFAVLKAGKQTKIQKLLLLK